VNDTLT